MHEPFDSDLLKQVFAETQVVRTPLSGIIQGYHILPYILVGPEERREQRSIEIRGKIRVSPRLVISPSVRGETYGDLFRESEVMDRALVARVFSFFYTSKHSVTLESEELKITKADRDPASQVNRALEELARREIINTGVILCPNVKFYPVSIDRFITEILEREFR
jgi:hypothetical protein